MIPLSAGFLDGNFEIVEQPTKTYKMHMENNRIHGQVDGIEAMKQAIFKILKTERFQYPMYSWNYGIETNDLWGEPVTWVCPELERRISEAILWDTRCSGIDNFEFNLAEKGVVHVTFTVHTIFGDIAAEKEVNF